jgi:hypothetical protein
MFPASQKKPEKRHSYQRRNDQQISNRFRVYHEIMKRIKNVIHNESLSETFEKRPLLPNSGVRLKF